MFRLQTIECTSVFLSGAFCFTSAFRFDNSKPFNSTGVDYAGPVLVLPVFNPQGKLHKVHIVLYTCAATRVVVLDVVDSTDARTFTAAETQAFSSSK